MRRRRRCGGRGRRRAECAESDPVKISGVKNCPPFFGHGPRWLLGPPPPRRTDGRTLEGAADDKFPILPRRHSAFLALARVCVDSLARIVGLVSYLWTLFDWLASVRPHSFARPPYLGGRDWESRWTHSASASRADTCRLYKYLPFVWRRAGGRGGGRLFTWGTGRNSMCLPVFASN